MKSTAHKGGGNVAAGGGDRPPTRANDISETYSAQHNEPPAS